MNNKYKILVIEDESNIRSLISTMLEAGGYQVIQSDTCASAILMYESHLPDLAILDLGLPDADGMKFLRYVRKDSLIPVVVLSARTDESDKIAALDLGANDYVTKPFSAGELLARIRAALRTTRHCNDEGRLPGGKFTLGEMTIDYDSRRTFLSGEEVKLTQTEYNILAFLSEHCGKLLTYSAVIKEIWGERADDNSIKKLQVNMANIRRKFGITPAEPKYIYNELGVGYRMDHGV